MRHREEDSLRRVEANHHAGQRGDEEEHARVDAHRVVRVEGEAEHRAAGANRQPLRTPPQHETGRHEQAQDHADPADDQLAGRPQGRRRARVRHQPQMQLVDVANPILRSRRADDATGDRAVPRIHVDRGPVAHPHHLDEVGARGDLDGGDARAVERGFHNGDEPIFVEPLRAGRGMPESGIDPALDVVLERHDRAGHAEDQQEERRNQSEVEVNFQDERSHRAILVRVRQRRPAACPS